MLRQPEDRSQGVALRPYAARAASGRAGRRRAQEQRDCPNLGICPGTVKIHLKHIFEKTGVRGRYGLALSGLKEKGYYSPMMPA